MNEFLTMIALKKLKELVKWKILRQMGLFLPCKNYDHRAEYDKTL